MAQGKKAERKKTRTKKKKSLLLRRQWRHSRRHPRGSSCSPRRPPQPQLPPRGAASLLLLLLLLLGSSDSCRGSSSSRLGPASSGQRPAEFKPEPLPLVLLLPQFPAGTSGRTPAARRGPRRPPTPRRRPHLQKEYLEEEEPFPSRLLLLRKRLPPSLASPRLPWSSCAPPPRPSRPLPLLRPPCP